MIRRLATTVVALAALAGAWAFLWPAQFGGQASWLVVEGPQLEPYYSDGDLVIARQHSTYAEGALVATDLGAGPVLGIVGDVDGEILGSPWLHLAGGGDAMTALAAIVLSWPFVLVAGAVGATGVLVARRRHNLADAQAASTAEHQRAAHTLAS